MKMKPVHCLLVLTCISIHAGAPVRVKPLPSPGFESRIREFVDNMPVVDTHEHLLSPEKLKQKTTLDFILLLQHYSADDIRSAGMSGKTFAMLMKDSLTVMGKWNILKPFWEAASNTAYNRAALLAADKLFGIPDINESTVIPLSEKIATAYKSDWINEVLLNRCKIDFLIQDSEDRSFGNERFRYVVRFDNFILINSKQRIISAERQSGIKIASLDDYVKALDSSFRKASEKGIVGIKTGLAYSRIIHYENVAGDKAEKIFMSLLNGPDKTVFPFNDVKPLQDYMMHRVLDLAEKNNLPVVIHTGLHAGNGNVIENSKPTHLLNLFTEYPDIKFVLYHGSYPYGGELSTLAKNFRNVYIDMCWLHIISPSYSERYLHEWLETVPASKIMGFGGDYSNVENVYSHLLFGKQVITRVLTEKVNDGYITELEAINIARLILHDNAVKIYRLVP